MQSRRDQVQAQSYVLGRLTSALVAGEPDGLENPHRRTFTGAVAGVLVAAIVVGGFAVYGFLRPGSASSWRKPGTLIVERDSGTRYVLAGGRLRPVLNAASARLLLGAAPKVVTVSRTSLAGVPHGQPVGIAGAPDALPPAATLAGREWTACGFAGRDEAGTSATVMTLAVSAPAGTPAIGRDEAVAVRADSGGDTHLLLGGERRRLTEDWMPRVLGFADAPTTVPRAWLDLVPAGADVVPPAVPGRGTGKVGQLYVSRAPDASERHYVLLPDGLSPLSATAYALLAGDPATGGRPRELGLSELGQLPVSHAPPLGADLPAAPPRPAPAPAGTAWCVRRQPTGAIDVVADRPLGAGDVVRDAYEVTRTNRTAAAVRVTAGTAGLARAARAGQAPGGGLFLITDTGTKYPLSGGDVADALGYPPGQAVGVPPELLDLLPTGPLLDPAQGWG